MRLGMLGRTVIVASALWMACGTVYFALSHAADATDKASTYLTECLEHITDATLCFEGQARVYKGHTADLEYGLWGFSAATAGLYLVAGLIVFFVLYGSARWIMAGRRVRH